MSSRPAIRPQFEKNPAGNPAHRTDTTIGKRFTNVPAQAILEVVPVALESELVIMNDDEAFHRAYYRLPAMGATDITHIAENYRKIQQRIQDAAARLKRDPESIRLVAVTKTVSVDSIREAFHSGLRHIGENRFQDALPKLDSLQDLDLTWHFIGHIQTNKAKKIAEQFEWIHRSIAWK